VPTNHPVKSGRSAYASARDQPVSYLESQAPIEALRVVILSHNIENQLREALRKQPRHQGRCNGCSIPLAASVRSGQNSAEHSETGAVRQHVCAACRNKMGSLVRAKAEVLRKERGGHRTLAGQACLLYSCVGAGAAPRPGKNARWRA
jgi:hypothetical protein